MTDEMMALRTMLEKGTGPYLWTDAAYVKVRQNGRLVSVGSPLPSPSTPMVAVKCWAWDRPVGGRDLLARVPAQAQTPRSGRGQAGDLRRS